MNIFLQLLDPAHQRFSVFPEFFAVNLDARLLHVVQGKYQRHLDLIKKLSHAHLIQLFQQIRHFFESRERCIRFSQILMLIAAHKRVDEISRNLNIK